MERNPHFIWGKGSRSENRINILKMNGMKQIYVLDQNQGPILKEKNDVLYFSLQYAPLLRKGAPNTTHHLFVNVRPRKKVIEGKCEK